MKKILIFICLTILSCSTWQKLELAEVFPNQMKFVENYNQSNEFSGDLFISKIYPILPDNYKLAFDVRALEMTHFPDTEICSKTEKVSIRKDENLIKYSKYLENKGYNLWTSPQIPHMLFYYHDSILINDIHNSYFDELIRATSQILSFDSLLFNQETEIEELLDTLIFAENRNTFLGNEIDKIEKEVEDYSKLLEESERNKKKVKKEIDDRKKRISDLAVGASTVSSAKPKSEPNPVKIKIPELEKPKPSTNMVSRSAQEIFKEYYNKRHVSIKGTSYNTTNTDKNGYSLLDKKMKTVLDVCVNNFKNPESFFSSDKYTPEELAKIKSWANFKIVSATRSPLHQLAIGRKNKFAAKELWSLHIQGLAIDFRFGGKNYAHRECVNGDCGNIKMIPDNYSNYNLFTRALEDCGLYFPLKKDAAEGNHAILAEYKNVYDNSLNQNFMDNIKSYVNDFKSILNSKINELEVKVNGNKSTLTKVEKRLVDVYKQSVVLENRIEGVDTKLSELKEKYNLSEQQIKKDRAELAKLISKEKKLRQKIAEKERRANREYVGRDERGSNTSGRSGERGGSSGGNRGARDSGCGPGQGEFEMDVFDRETGEPRGRATVCR